MLNRMQNLLFNFSNGISVNKQVCLQSHNKTSSQKTISNATKHGNRSTLDLNANLAAIFFFFKNYVNADVKQKNDYRSKMTPL